MGKLGGLAIHEWWFFGNHGAQEDPYTPTLTPSMLLEDLTSSEPQTHVHTAHGHLKFTWQPPLPLKVRKL